MVPVAASSNKDCDIVVEDDRDSRISFQRRKGSSLDRSYRTLPRHLERGKNLSKRFRKSCRNWATSKGLLNNNTKEDTVEKKNNDATDVDDNEDNDIVVIDLEEDPELKYKAASETDIGQLVADLVRDARRNNTLPRPRSRTVTDKDPEVSSLNKSLSAISIADNDDITQAEIDSEASPSILNNETEDEEQVKTIDEDTKSSSSEVLETSFDEMLVNSPTSEEKDQELHDESIGETSFYNGIMQATEFLVTAKYSKELFKEETTSSLDSSQVDQDGFTDLNKVNVDTDETREQKVGNDFDGHFVEGEDSNLGENESAAEKTDKNQLIAELTENANIIENIQGEVPLEDAGSVEPSLREDDNQIEQNNDGDTVTESDDEPETEDQEDEDTESEEENVNEDFYKETGNIGRGQLIDEDEGEEGGGADLQTDHGLLDDDSDNEFESIAKISALDFLNDEDDDVHEVTGRVTNSGTNYFSSSFLFNHPVFTKESSFPSLKLDKEDNNNSSPYLEAINLELDGKENPWNQFRYSSVEMRVNPMYKDEDSLNSNNSLILADGKTQQFSNNLQEFFDIWEMFSKDQDDEETTLINHQESNCSLLFHNLEAIQEEDESEEESDVDENNNDCDHSDNDTDEEIAEFTMTGHENPVTVYDTGNHDLIVSTKNNHENRANGELCNSEGFDIHKIDPDLFEYAHVKERTHQSLELENFIEELLKSILDKVFEPESNEKMIVEETESLIDEIDVDDEYSSCDSPDDLRPVSPGSGVSTDEGIEATDDDEDDIEHKNNQYNHKNIDSVRKSPTQL